MERQEPAENIPAGMNSYYVDLLGQMAAKLAETAKVSFKKEAELTAKLEEWQYLATHDSLTGGLNRQGLELIGPSIKNPLAVLKFDPTNFKAVNDEVSPKAGDEMLRVVYFLILSSVRPNDIVGRWGGDEFVAIIVRDEEDSENQINKQSDRRNDLGINIEERRDRIAKNVLYLKEQEESLKKFNFDIAVGATEWDGSIPLRDAVGLADPEMYAHKAVQHKNGQHRAV